MQKQQPEGVYPRFDQSGQPQAFPISHENPYNQQNPGYTPPHQYGIAGQQPDSNFPREKDMFSQAEVQEIDDRLSSGAYCCYYYWLFFIVVYSVYNVFKGLNSAITSLPYIILAFGSAVECAYAIIMINALKKKDLQKAELGVKLAFATCGMLFCCILVEGFMKIQRDGTRIVPYLGGTIILVGAYYALVIALPAMKIRVLLERREAALAQSSNLTPYNVGSPSQYNILP